MHRQKYYRAKIPLSLVLLFLANVFLVMALELMFVYKYPATVDEATLGKYDSAWVGSTILSQDSYSSSLDVSLVELPDGSRILLTTKPHGIAYGRAKLTDVQNVELTEEEQVFYIRNGIHTSEIAVTGGDTVTLRYGHGGTLSEKTTIYMVLAAVLETMELGLYQLIKKNG